METKEAVRSKPDVSFHGGGLIKTPPQDKKQDNNLAKPLLDCPTFRSTTLKTFRIKKFLVSQENVPLVMLSWRI